MRSLLNNLTKELTLKLIYGRIAIVLILGVYYLFNFPESTDSVSLLLALLTFKLVLSFYFAGKFKSEKKQSRVTYAYFTLAFFVDFRYIFFHKHIGPIIYLVGGAICFLISTIIIFGFLKKDGRSETLLPLDHL